jgi:hypothetical protein
MRPARGGRAEPQGLNGILKRITVEQGWIDNLNGGSVIDQWPTLCPQYVGLVQPVHYDDASNRLDLRPSSHTYAAQLRLLGGQLAKQINDKMGRPVVRTIRVLPVGPISTVSGALPEPDRTEPQGPVKTRESASPGYRQALVAALEHRPEPRHTDPYIAAALARQEAALRTNRAPEAVEPEQLTERRVDRSEAVRRAALARKRQEAAGLTEPRRAFDVA